jgi:hypothetical protein
MSISLFDETRIQKTRTERYLTFKWSYDYTTDEQITALETLFSKNNIKFILYRSKGYYHHEWIVNKSGKQWKEIIKLVNSIKAVRYNYITSDKEKMKEIDGKLIIYVF